MRKLLFLLLILPTVAFAQSTTVSGTVTDLGGQTWNNGTYTFTFVANSLFPNPSQYTWTGGALPTNLSGNMNGSGAYSQSVPANTSITPPGSTWAIKFCPLATAGCYSIPTITITGATQTVNASPPAILINLLNPQPGGNIVAYSVAEIVGAQVGSQYYLIGTGLQLCTAASGNNCTSWSAVGGGGGGGAFSSITSGTNTTAAMVVGTGASLGTSGSGTITATAAPFSGVSGATNTTAAMVVGSGASLGTSGTGTISATAAPFSGVTSATNTTAAMVVGTGASLGTSGTGSITATNGSGGTAFPAGPNTASFYLSPYCPLTNTGNCINTFADTQEADDCSWSSAASDINCNTSHFVAADVGKSVMGASTCAAFQSASAGTGFISASGLPTIASFVSGTHVTLSANPANSASFSATFPQGACFIWGHPDDTGASTVDTAITTAPQCPKIELAAGFYMFTQPHFFSQPKSCVDTPAGIGNSTPNPNGSNFGNVFYPAGLEVQGRGANDTIIYLTPNFPGSGNCTKGPGAPATALACFVIPVMGRWEDFQISGGYQTNPTGLSTSNTVLIYGAGVNSVDNFTCTNMGGFSSITNYGMMFDWQSQLYQVNNVGCGSIGLITVNGHSGHTAIKLTIENSLLADLAVGTSDSYRCFSCVFFNSQATSTSSAPFDIINFGNVYCESCVITSGSIAGPTNPAIGIINNAAAATATFRDSAFVFNGAGNAGNGSINCGVSGSVTTLENTSLTSNSSGFDYSDVSGCVLNLIGSNTFTPRFSVSGQVLGMGNDFKQTLVASGNLVLSAGWGSTATKTALLGGDQPITFTITNSGTGQVANPTIAYTFPTALPKAPFSCTATQTGGTNASLNPFTSSSLSTTGVTFTATGTPTASSTEIMQVTCVTP